MWLITFISIYATLYCLIVGGLYFISLDQQGITGFLLFGLFIFLAVFGFMAFPYALEYATGYDMFAPQTYVIYATQG